MAPKVKPVGKVHDAQVKQEQRLAALAASQSKGGTAQRSALTKTSSTTSAASVTSAASTVTGLSRTGRLQSPARTAGLLDADAKQDLRKREQLASLGFKKVSAHSLQHCSNHTKLFEMI